MNWRNVLRVCSQFGLGFLIIATWFVTGAAAIRHAEGLPYRAGMDAVTDFVGCLVMLLSWVIVTLFIGRAIYELDASSE